MVDKSWGVSASPDFRVRTNDGPEERAAKRADARELPTADRAEAMAQRQQARVARREADLADRERERTDRREREQQMAAGDPHAAAAGRRRSSGRRDVVREQRDTSGYATLVDGSRIRELAGRGATIAGLAAVFGITPEEVEQALADGD